MHAPYLFFLVNKLLTESALEQEPVELYFSKFGLFIIYNLSKVQTLDDT